jgi:Tfp pilus assembly protein PilN
MQNCLGLYIEENIIKYAKISKEKDNIKIDSFGVKFYDDINKAIKQVIEETFSYKTPISVNLAGEKYNFFNMFSLLNKNDLKKAIDLEFEDYCSEKGQNVNAFETRYAAVKSLEDKEKLKVIFASESKSNINNIKQNLEGYKLINISPLPMSIVNVTKLKVKENALIINIEKNTTITTVLDQKIYNISKIEEGSGEILKKISEKENSYAKAYEICKNTTIYTSETQSFLEEGASSYLEDIMPTLYTIVGKVQKILNESVERIEKIYITGTAASINNIDLYFQEYLGDIKCEILKPYFVQNLSKDVNIKDYIEVNSAMALALHALGEGVEGVNFKKPSLMDKMPEIKTSKKPSEGKKKSFNINFKMKDFSNPITKGEAVLIRSAVSVLMFIVIYTIFSIMLVNQMVDVENDVKRGMAKVDSEIARIEADVSTLNKRASEYSTLTTQLETAAQKISDINRSKNSIPNLLNKIMFTIPEKVQITSIENTKGTHIVIQAQAVDYDQLGYFKAKLKTDNILTNVVSTSGVKQDGIVRVTIEGELP